MWLGTPHGPHFPCPVCTSHRPFLLFSSCDAFLSGHSFLFPAPELLGVLMDLNIPKVGLRAVSEYMSRRGVAYTAATPIPPAHPLTGPILGHMKGEDQAP